jgi:hypothetical protein
MPSVNDRCTWFVSFAVARELEGGSAWRGPGGLAGPTMDYNGRAALLFPDFVGIFVAGHGPAAQEW